jgi:hypothetical protein
VALSPGLEVGVIVLTNFGFDPALRVGRFLIAEAVRSAREQLIPTPYAARIFWQEGDWSNAAWAFDVLDSIDPVGGYADRRDRAQVVVEALKTLR